MINNINQKNNRRNNNNRKNKNIKNKISPFTPMHDRVFKKVFLAPQNRESLINLTHAITQIPFERLADILPGDPGEIGTAIDKKMGIWDLKASLKDKTLIGYEVQNGYVRDLSERIIKRLATLINEQADVGKSYNTTAENHVILISKNRIPGVTKTKNYYTHYAIVNIEKSGEILSTLHHIHVINLANLPQKYDGSLLWTWVKFFKSKTEEDFEMAVKLNPAIRPAYNAFFEMSQDKQEREFFAQVRNAKNFEQQTLIAEREYGEKRGEKRGAKKEREQFVLTMLENNATLDLISTYTKLSEKQIKAIAQKHNITTNKMDN